MSGTAGAQQQPAASLPGEPGASEQGPKIRKCKRDLSVWVCRGDARPPCTQGCQVGVTHQCNLYFMGPANRLSHPAVPGSPTGLAPFPPGKTLGADSRQTARCNSRSSRTARGLCKDPAGRKLVLGEKKAVVTTEVPTHTCRHAEVALTGP